MLGIGEKEFRRLDESELPRARAHLEGLDTEDLFHHFHQFMDPIDFDRWEERAPGHELIGCFVAGELKGLAEIAYAGTRSELALSVDPGFRRQGIGTELFERACEAAKAYGARTLSVLVTRGDREMLDMAIEHDGYTIYRRGESLIMPGRSHGLARWLTFDLERMPGRSIFGRAVRDVRRALGLEEERSTGNLATYD